MKKYTLLFVAISVAWAMAQATTARAEDSAKPMIKVKPPTAAVKSVKPPATAKKATTAGKGKTAVDTANSAGDMDSTWVDEIDIDGDGDLEAVSWLWDDEDKVLYLYQDTDVDCAWTDGVASTSLLVALYGDGNTAMNPVGSGWWVSTLDQGECAAEETDVYGCRFDASGTATMCDDVDSYADDDIVFGD